MKLIPQVRIPKEKRKDFIIIILVIFIVGLLISSSGIEISRNFIYGLIFVVGGAAYITNKQSKKVCPGYFGRIDAIREEVAQNIHYKYSLANFPKEGVESMAVIPGQQYLMGFVKTNTLVVYDHEVGGIDGMRYVQLSDYKDELEKSEMMRDIMREEKQKRLKIEEMVKRGFSKDEAERKVYEEDKK